MTEHHPDGPVLRRPESVEAAAILAHELTTPLASIRGLAAVLERHGERMSAAERVDFAARIVRQTERATRLVRMHLQPPGGADANDVGEPCQPAEVMTAVVEECALPLRARSLETDLTLSDLRWVLAGADVVHRILLNLISNAAKFAAPSTTIDLQVRAEGPAVAIEVTSTGHRVESGQVSVMFEPGGRLPRPATVAAPGNGLGLAIVADLVAAAGGSVAVDVDGRRTTVSVALPARHPGAAEDFGRLGQPASSASSGA